jgi:hypothetical protein
MTARWSQMVLALDGPDADVDQGDARAALGHQVICRHLMLAPGGGGDKRLRLRRLGGDDHVARRR